jgi:hypothetical protein
MFADTRFENEDSAAPTAFSLWVREMELLEREHAFDKLGTYCLDSGTTWSEAVMNQILVLAGRKDGTPQLQDYQKQMQLIGRILKELTSKPCDFLFMSHLELHKDELSGKVNARILMTGKLSIRIPLLFDEVYIAQAKKTSSGIEYSLQTASDGYYIARTRLGAKGKFLVFEKPDIKALLRKAGMSDADKV